MELRNIYLITILVHYKITINVIILKGWYKWCSIFGFYYYLGI